MLRFVSLCICLFALFASHSALAAPSAMGLEKALDTVAGDGRPLSLSLQILLLMGLLTILPSLVLMMPSFTRIIIVLSILRQALGLQQTPPNQVLVGLALFLSIFVMQPVLSTINTQALEPYGRDEVSFEQALSTSATAMHGFMMKQTRKTDIALFSEIARAGKFANDFSALPDYRPHRRIRVDVAGHGDAVADDYFHAV